MPKRVVNLCTALLLISSQAFCADTVVTIRADSWYPMNGDVGAADPGYMIELAQKAFASGGMTVDYKTLPWTRALDTVKKGEFDCVVGATTADAEGFILPKESWGNFSASAFVKKGDAWRYAGTDSLAKRKTAIIQDYSYGEEMDKYIVANPSVFDKNGGDDALTKNIRKLGAGRVNTLIETASVMNATLKKLNMEGQFEDAGEINTPESMYIACSPANKARSEKLTALVDEQTKALRSSGELAKILAKYGLKDWQ
jgi:polar amino acid transport system substrate-binding protein